MLNGPNNRNPSDHPQQVTLRIPSVSPIVTFALLILYALMLAASLFNRDNTATLLDILSAQPIAILLGQSYRLLSGLLFIELAVSPRAWVGALHTAVGLYTLYIVGNATEKLWGNLRFAVLFLLSGLTGSVVSVALTATALVPESATFVTATGAILGALAGELVYLYKHRKLYARRAILRRNFLLGVLVVNLLTGAFAARVDLFGMLGGFVGGVVLASFISPFHLPRQDPEQPTTLITEDVNPLRTRIVPIMLYLVGILGLLVLSVVVLGR